MKKQTKFRILCILEDICRLFSKKYRDKQNYRIKEILLRIKYTLGVEKTYYLPKLGIFRIIPNMDKTYISLCSTGLIIGEEGKIIDLLKENLGEIEIIEAKEEMPGLIQYCESVVDLLEGD